VAARPTRTEMDSPSRLADHFCNYLFHEYQGHARHVERVSTWLGFLILGLAKLKVSWRPYRSRQLVFERAGKRYKARYNHKIKPRGGIEFVEVANLPGVPDVSIVLTIASLAEAARFYDKPHL
jgi:hypothetical protein